MIRRVKCYLLSHLLGNRGHRYHRKYMGLRARRDFEIAIRRSTSMICIDLGANIGEYTRKMATCTKHVIAFEPDPWAHAALRTNVADLHNVSIVKAAVGTCDKQVLLYRHPQFNENPSLFSESSSVIASKINVVDDTSIAVHQVDFIRYLEELDEDIGVLKIDIEGAELELLEALFDRADLLARIDYIFAETHETRISGHGPRVTELQERAKRIGRPSVNLYWH